MTARDDLIAAAHRLAERGRRTFSPGEILDEAHAGGSNYPDQTLRTVLTGHESADLGSPESDRKPFVRTGRGVYSLAPVRSAPLGAAPRVPEGVGHAPDGQEALPDPQNEWHWEGNVQGLVVRALALDGWTITRVADTASREHGHDIAAERSGTQLIVEVKGYPSSHYVRGDRAGEPKQYAPQTQARVWFSNALMSGVLMREEHPDHRVVLALPDYPTYASLAGRMRNALRTLVIEVWLVDQQGRLRDGIAGS